MTEQEIFQLQNSGIVILKNQVNNNLINGLKVAMECSFEYHQQIQSKQGNEINTYGVALNVLPESYFYFQLLQLLIDNGTILSLQEHYFKSKFILNSFSALDNQPNNPNFSSKVHRDLKSYSNGITLMLNALVMIDDFTEFNGATKLLPYSHKIEEKPSDEQFNTNCISATGQAGDILLFDSNIWHCSAINQTQNRRRAIPITFSKSFMKQLFDYPRAFSKRKITAFEISDNLRSLIGFDSRVPSTLEEWYLPAEQRFYKPNQD